MAVVIRQPLVIAVLTYCAGCICAHVFTIPVSGTQLCLCAGLLLTAAAAACFKKNAFAAAIPVLGMLFLAGYVLILLKLYPLQQETHILRYADEPNTLIEAYVSEPAAETPHRTRLKLSVLRRHTEKGAYPCTGNLLLSMKKPLRGYAYGDRILFPCTVRRPKNFSNPGGFDYVRHLAYRDIYATAFLENDTSVTKLASCRAGITAWIEILRTRIRTTIQQTLACPSRDLMMALIIGEQGTIPDGLRDQFSALGITHILSISGLHVSIFALITFCLLYAVLKVFPRLLLYLPAKKIALCASIFPVIGYCLIAGMSTPAARSGLMVACFLGTLLLDRPQNLLHTLFVAAFAILVITPHALFEISFQLSFAAVFSLIVLVPSWQKLFSPPVPDPFSPVPVVKFKVFNHTKDSLLTSAAALLGTAPLVAYYFYTFAPSGLVTNIVMVPLAGFVIVPLGLAAATSVFISAPLANCLFVLCGYCADFFVNIADLLYAVLGDGYVVTKPHWWEIGVFYGLLFSTTACTTKRNWATLAGACLLFAGVEYLQFVQQNMPDGTLRVTFLDVGSGDAAVVQLPDRQVMLIDGGGLMDDSFDTGKAVIAPFLYSLGIKQVQYIIMTHPHRDHGGGLPYIARHFGMREFWHNGSNLKLDSLQAVTDIARVNGAAIIDYSGSVKQRAIGTVVISFLASRGSAMHAADQANNDSLVMKITYGTQSVLFTGDILNEAAAGLVAAGNDVQATVLKIPHHGGLTSASELFLDAVRPQIAIVSGRRRGRLPCPHPEVAQQLADRGVQYFVTGRCGAVTVTTDGTTMKIATYVPDCRGQYQ